MLNQKEYQKKYRIEHKNIAKKYMHKYRIENKLELKNKQHKKYVKSKTKIIQKSKKYYQEHREKCIERMKKYYNKNRTKLKKQVKEYNKSHKEEKRKYNYKYRKINIEKIREHHKNRLRNDIKYRLVYYLRIRILDLLRGKTKSKQTLQLLGCSVKQLQHHLESKFQSGMTWENHSLDGWHIDHIRPCASFDLSKPEEQCKCFHYTNLQPLWAEDNLSKGRN